MKSNYLFSLLAVLSLLMGASCQSNKVAYGNSYYFKATPRPAPARLSASTAPAPVAAQTLSTSFSQPVVPSLRRVASDTEPTLSRRAVRQERRAHRKSVRKQLKQWLKNTPTSDTDVQESQRMKGLTKAGVITGAGALVLLVIGLLATNGFLVGLGAILLAIAVVLILIDVL